MGDLVDNGQQYTQWKSWFAAIAGYSNQIPIVPVVGNHETYTPIPENKFSLPIYFTQQFKVEQNGPEGLKGQVYSFDYGNAHFVILDSQLGEERRFLPDSLERQQAWLAKDLAATNKLWKFVFIHRPAYHNRQAESLPDPKTAAFIPTSLYSKDTRSFPAIEFKILLTQTIACCVATGAIVANGLSPCIK